MNSIKVYRNPREFVDECIYRNYRSNRQRSPEIPPVEWALIFGGVQTARMERRLQQETQS